MCQTATASKPQTTKPVRSCGWVIRPESTPTGGTYGAFYIRAGKVTDYYRCSLEQADDMAICWLVEKETAAGYAEAYYVSLPPPGVFGSPCCSCPGWRFNGQCRHGNALAALLSKLVQ